jgi:hypothetical protein
VLSTAAADGFSCVVVLTRSVQVSVSVWFVSAFVVTQVLRILTYRNAHRYAAARAAPDAPDPLITGLSIAIQRRPRTAAPDLAAGPLVASKSQPYCFWRGGKTGVLHPFIS